jgi:metallophosphoesterase superfamily enzyme
VLVRGNHDAKSGDPPPGWGVDVVAEPCALPPFLACHVPASPRTGYALCGHVHPGVVVHGRADESARLPVLRHRPPPGDPAGLRPHDRAGDRQPDAGRGRSSRSPGAISFRLPG